MVIITSDYPTQYIEYFLNSNYIGVWYQGNRSVKYSLNSRSSQFGPKVAHSDAYKGQGCILNKQKDTENQGKGVPHGLVVRIQHLHCCSLGLISGLGTKITQQAAACCSQKKKKTNEKPGGTVKGSLTHCRNCLIWMEQPLSASAGYDY